MALQQEVYKWHRLVLVRFQRATTGQPNATKPDVDDRGFAATEHGPVVGLVQGNNITVRLTREHLDKAAALFVTSSDKSTFTVASPASGALPGTVDMDIQINGVKGGAGSPVLAKLEVRFGSATGPIIHQLTVWVFQPLTVALTPHMVTIADAAGNSTGSVANVAQIMKLVAAIWQACGVTISIQPAVNDNVVFATNGIVSDNPFPGS